MSTIKLLSVTVCLATLVLGLLGAATQGPRVHWVCVTVNGP